MSTEDNAVTLRLYRVRKTLTKMLANRKYLVSDSEKNMTFDEFKEKYGFPADRTSMTQLAQKIDDPTDKLMIFFPLDEKVGVKPIRGYVADMKEDECHRGIIVVQKDISPFAKQALNEMRPKYTVEHFTENELLIDITEHDLVPTHEILSAAEKKALLARYKLKDTQLPRMKPHDPISKYFGLARGQVVKIIRSSETAGRYVTYRIVL